MKVLEIRNVYREDGCIYYFRKFRGDAVVQFPLGALETPITFSIEASPLGTKNIEVNINHPIDYPVIPVKNALKEFIGKEDSEGKLP
ncbi:MAG: hypothetical protein M0P01_02950 [Treponema sp.]|jgi:hypothetical protein|nr:hypothetical protein [Treponema sp.]